MKTSELKKIVEDNGFILTKRTYGYLFIEKEGWFLDFIFKVREEVVEVHKLACLSTPESKRVMEALIKYSETPLSEREEEKKYCFGLYGGIDKNVDDRFLKLDESYGTFYFYEEYENMGRFKGLFTEKEIENFPSEIKGAIECGFLVKVEVE